jgi:hypothetical protein
MSSMSMSPRLSRLLALAILAGVVAGTVNLAVLPLIDRWQAAEARVADAAGWRARLAAAVKRIPDLERALKEAEVAAGQRKGVLHVETESLGTAEFQKMVQRVIAESGNQARSVQALTPRREHGALQLGMRVKAAGEETSLVRLLEAVERHNPALAVRSLNVSAGPAGRSGAGSFAVPAATSTGGPPDGPTLVDMQIDFEVLAVEDRK